MRLLAIDTSTEACSAALLIGSDVIARAAEPGRGHADLILSMVGELLAEAGLLPGALDAIAACVGPGAFTGVRICVAAAQGLAFGAGLPVVPVTSLEALSLARLQRGATHVLACLDARMAEVYWACHVADPARGIAVAVPAAVGPPAGLRLPESGPGTAVHWAGIGRGLDAYPQIATRLGLSVDPADALALPHAGAIVRLGALRFGLGEGIDPAALAPLYLRDTVALTEAQRGLR